MGAKDALKLSLTTENQASLMQSNVPEFQIILKSNQNTQSLRNLTAEHVNSLIKVIKFIKVPFIYFILYLLILICLGPGYRH